MFKKLTLLAMAIGALVAFAVPAAASAEALLTEEGEKAAESVTATSDPTNPVKFTFSWGTTECSSVMLSIGLIENSTATATGSGSGTASGCKFGAGVPWEVTSITISEMHLDSNTSGTLTISFTADILGYNDCSLMGTLGLTYAHSTNAVQLASPNKLVDQKSCGIAAGISGGLILEESGGGNPVTTM